MSRIRKKFYNLQVDVLDRPGFFRELRYALSLPQKITINFLNAHCFNIAQRNAEYRDALNESTFLLNDGVGIDLAGRLCGIRFPENLNGTDLIPEMMSFFQENDMSVFCYGAKDHVIESAVAEIRTHFPRLTVAGYSHGYVTDPKTVVDKVNESGADVVILGLGVPKQELWVSKNMAKTVSAKVFISGGAVFDFISGNAVRAPALLRRARLEWLYRLAQEPVRLFSRYVLGGFVFFYYVLIARP